MAFNLKSNNNNASPKTSARKKSSSQKRGVGNYNILNFGNSSLYDFRKKESAYDFRITVQPREEGAYDEGGDSYSLLDAAAIVIAGLTCTKKGTRRGTNHYFFENKNEDSENEPEFTGSARFDIKLNDEDEASVERAKKRMLAALAEMQQMPELFEHDFYVKFASVYLDPSSSTSYAYKSRVLFYNKPYDTDLFEVDVDSLMALAFAALTLNGWQGAIFSNDKGYGGSLSVKLDAALYAHVCDLCGILELGKETKAVSADADTDDTDDNSVTPHKYSLDEGDDEELGEEYY